MKHGFDPIITTRLTTRFNDTKWRLGMLTDYGGFGIGSDDTWQINPFGGYQFGDTFENNASYRWLHSKYESGTDTNRFLYDITTSGPEIRFMFHF